MRIKVENQEIEIEGQKHKISFEIKTKEREVEEVDWRENDRTL